jgi:hypothetical protein
MDWRFTGNISQVLILWPTDYRPAKRSGGVACAYNTRVAANFPSWTKRLAERL